MGNLSHVWPILAHIHTHYAHAYSIYIFYDLHIITGPMSIQSLNRLCVEAKEGVCLKKDTSEIHFAHTDCKNRNSMFRLDGGILIHHCTGNRVCTRNHRVNSGARLVVSPSCSRAPPLKFRREGETILIQDYIN